MALYQYLQDTQRLLGDTKQMTFNTADLARYVNIARLHIAGETECIRALPTLAVTSSLNIYPFSVITNLPTGTNGVYNVRQVTINLPGFLLSDDGQILLDDNGNPLLESGTVDRLLADDGSTLTDDSGSKLLADDSATAPRQVYMGSRPFPWANLYWFSNTLQGTPNEWSQFGIGVSGSLFINPSPNDNYTLILDVSCVPIILSQDTDVEAIPYPMTDCIPYLAAYYAYITAQNQQSAQGMLKMYEDFKLRARMISVPNVLPNQYDLYDQGQIAQQPQQRGG